MANYTCEFSKIKDGDSTKYVQVPNENTAKRDTLVFADDFNHTPLRNLDKYKITKQSKVWSDEDENKVETTVTYSREFKSDTKGVVTGDDSGEEIIYCAFKQEKGNDNDVIYIKHDDLTSKAKEDEKKYPVYTYTKPNYTEDTDTPYTFGWL